MKKEELETKFLEGLFEEHTPSGMISVSKLIYPCLRKPFYETQHGQFFDINTAYTFWLGKAIHNMSFLGEDEIEVKWNGIIGRIDEYDRKTGTLVEKKTCKSLPRSINPHHKTQIEYYYALCVRNKIKVESLWMLYLEKGYSAHKFMEVKPRAVSVIEKEMVERKEILEKALKTKEPPERHIDWLCGYCPFAPLCFSKQKTKTTQSS